MMDLQGIKDTNSPNNESKTFLLCCICGKENKQGIFKPCFTCDLEQVTIKVDELEIQLNLDKSIHKNNKKVLDDFFSSL